MRLSELLDLSVLRRLAEANYKASGMPIGIVDATDGSLVLGYGWQDICVLFHRDNPLTLARCRESDAFINDHRSEAAPCEYVYKNGLRDIGIPINVAGQHVATLFMGQFFYEGEAPDRQFFVRQAREFGFDEATYLAALDRVPVLSRAVVQNTLAYNTALAQFIGDLAERELHRRDYGLLFHNMLEGFAYCRMVWGEDGRAQDFIYLDANDAFSRITGLRDVVGKKVSEVIPGIREEYQELLETYGRVARTGRAERFEIDFRPLGTCLDISVYQPQPDHFVAVFDNITDRKRAEEALRHSEAQLRLSTLAAEIGVWSWIPGTSEVTVSSNWRQMFGIDPDVRVTFETWRDALHPDDRDRAVRELNEAAESHREFDTEYRVVCRDGTTRWVVDRGRASYDESGRATIMGGINIDITLRKQAEQELHRANEQLRDAGRRKDEFLSMLSHELRNPLAPIRNSIYILRNAEPSSEQSRHAEAVIERQTEHLTRLVDDLLDATRIARGKIELRRSRIDLREVVLRAGDDFRLLLEDRGIAFHLDLPDATVWVDADPTRISQVIGNLLQNAAKFTSSGAEVALSLTVHGGDARVQVRDTGAGIDAALLPNVFEPFVQGERSLARTEGGLGLGLALVKGITALHGGTVHGESAGKGKGAVFTITLPLGLAAAVAGPNKMRNERTGTGRRVLVVDDNHDAAETLADIVRMLGHTVDVAYDGPSAVEKARVDLPDVVLCDIGLPGMSGYEVAQALRSMARERMRLIAVSGYAQPQDVKRAHEAGFDAHVAKPAHPDDIERLLASS